MNEKLEMIALAGLLHDIGKFALRAGEGGTRIWDDQARADYGYKHALLTADFVEKYVPEGWRKGVLSGAGRHHRPETALDLVVKLADHLSAGERSSPASDTESRTSHPQRLLSIFCLINADGDKLKARAYWPLAELRMHEDAIFPGTDVDQEGDWRTYEELWKKFKAKAEGLRAAFEVGGNLSSYLESMLLLMQQFTWCIPSAYDGARPDASLYDQSRMTGALAAVLADEEEQTLAVLVAEPKAERPLAALIGGDISGVQDFIYTITSRGAAGALRGRSFYLQLLTDVVARFVLRRLDLPITNLIYAGGGNFYLLARPDDGERLRDIQAELSRVLLKAHGGELYVALAGEPLRGMDFFEGRISMAWGRVIERFQAAKRQRFAELSDDLAHVFEPQGHGGNRDKECQVCGYEHPDTDVEPGSQTDENPEGVRKCPPCLKFEELGEDLRQASFLHLEEIDAHALPAGAARPAWRKTLEALGWQANVLKDFPQSPLQEGRGIMWALKDEAATDLQPGPRLAVGRKLLVNVTPTLTAEDRSFALKRGLRGVPDVGRVKPFDVMEAQSYGTKRVGVLRMDVDDMGVLFANGLGTAATLSRIAALSFAVSLYFEGWVEHLAETLGDNRVYSIYSGGDDLFFVGSWDKIVELARTIRVDLGRYAAGHPDIHASAGIALIGGKYPLYQAARDAGEAEAQAKALQWGEKQRKDAVSFLNLALPWHRFGLETACPIENFETSHGLMHFLARLSSDDQTGEKAAPKAAIQKLMRQYEQYDEAEKKRRLEGVDRNKTGETQVLWGPWMWRSFYTIRQMHRRTRDAPDLQHELLRLSDLFKPETMRDMGWIGMAARWAELLTRKES